MKLHPYFPKLFEPGQIGKVRLKNRIVEGPWERHTPGAGGQPTERTVDYYVQRAKGGVGLIIVGSADIGLGGRNAHFLDLSHNKYILEHCLVTDAVHLHGAKIAIQLCAIGRKVPPGYSGRGQEAIGPSPIPAKMVGEIVYPVPRPLDKGEIYDIMDMFARAAYRVRAAGYDMVEIHAAHGFLLNSFMSPFMNKRTDEFGGSLKNRMRFPIGVVKRIQEMVGDDFPIIFRMSADEFIEEGVTTKESPLMAKMLEEAGVAAVDCTSGIDETYWKCNDIMRLPEGFKAYIWDAVKKKVTIPVIGQGAIRSPELAEKVLRENMADFIAMTRPLAADPDWPKKAAEGRSDDIRKCISCNECHPGMGGISRIDRWPGHCAINPDCGRERDFYEIKPAEVKKKVMVIGSGPAGMEAARVASQRGHDVTLYERDGKLGGQLPLCSKPPGKTKINWFLEYLTFQLEKQNVKVELNTEVTPELVKKVKPDVVIVATGSEPIIPDVPGINDKKVVTAHDVLADMMKIKGEKVLVAGGGLVGVETAEFLAEQGNKVTVLEMLPKMAQDMEILHRKMVMDALKENKAVLLTERRLLEITDKGATIENTKTREREEIEADWVVLAVGVKPRKELIEAVEDIVDEVYTAGDCEKPRKIMEATYEGSLWARRV